MSNLSDYDGSCSKPRGVCRICDKWVYSSPTNRCGLSETQCIECIHCGEPFPLPVGDPNWAASVIDAFVAAHACCGEGDDA